MAASSADRHMHEYGRPPRPDAGLPKSGDVLHLGRKASVQFSTPILFRVIRIHDWTTYDGWVWLDGYQLNIAGDAVERRSVFVQIAGLRWIPEAPDPRTRNTARIPRQRSNGQQRADEQVVERTRHAKEIRAWANANDVTCPKTGFIPKTVVDAWEAR
jgi:hypothetical protein